MAYKGVFPVPITVSQGGTGDTTLTNLAVGNGATAFGTCTVTGTANQITVTNGSGATANPTISLASTVVNATQASFSAVLSALDTNVTGDGSLYTLGTTGNILTINVNRGSNLTTAGVFTAPVTGKYLFQLQMQFNGTSAGANDSYIQIVTTANTFRFGRLNYTPLDDTTGGGMSIFASVVAPMTSGDTATFQGAVLNGAAKTISVRVGNRTFVSGALIC